ncbi:Uncharacterised protein [Chlamydia trachomatis]|nr:Uncharacterised protein [Chlamydia trachomatis]
MRERRAVVCCVANRQGQGTATALLAATCGQTAGLQEHGIRSLPGLHGALPSVRHPSSGDRKAAWDLPFS